jgi:hypothetical protein
MQESESQPSSSKSPPIRSHENGGVDEADDDRPSTQKLMSQKISMNNESSQAAFNNHDNDNEDVDAVTNANDDDDDDDDDDEESADDLDVKLDPYSFSDEDLATTPPPTAGSLSKSYSVDKDSIKVEDR